MIRLRAARAALRAAVAMCSLVGVASAGAAAWQGPATISAASANANGSPKIALAPSGTAVAAWWEDTSGGSIVMARRYSTSPWGTPLTIATGVGATPLFTGVDDSGHGTVLYTSGGSTRVATWVSGTLAATVKPLEGPALTIGDLAVNAGGDAVFAGWHGTPAELTIGYRHGAGGEFVLSAYPYSAIGFAVDATRVAINDSGTAVVIFHAGTLRAVRRTATIDWPTAAETVTATAGVNADPVVGIDGAGNVVAAFTYGSPVKVVRASLRPPAGSWLESGDLSPATPGSSATSLSLPVSTTGLAALVWLQTTDATQSVKARPGTTGTGFPGGAEEVADAGALTPAAAIGDDGTLVTVWERGTSAGNVGQARVRSPGAAGAWGDIRTVTSAHANSTTPSLAADGLGDFATVSAPYDGTYHPVRLSSYDAAPPSVSGAFASGHLHARTPATLNVTARDAWSGVGDPAWTFGDGGTGTGIAATHIYARAGTYTAHVSVSDASGNTAGRDLTVVIGGPVEAALTRARFDVTWTRSRARGTLALAGRTPFHSTYVIEVSKGRTRLLRVPLLLGYPGSPASFSIKLRVPATAVPGTYRVELQPVTPGVGSNALRAKLAAPTEGVVDNGFLSGTRTGKARTSLTRARTVWARFHLAAVPKGKLTLTWYRMAGRKRVALRSVSRPPVATVRDSLAVLGMRGTITAVLRRSGTVIFESSVRLT